MTPVLTWIHLYLYLAVCSSAGHPLLRVILSFWLKPKSRLGLRWSGTGEVFQWYGSTNIQTQMQMQMCFPFLLVLYIWDCPVDTLSQTILSYLLLTAVSIWEDTSGAAAHSPLQQFSFSHHWETGLLRHELWACDQLQQSRQCNGGQATTQDSVPWSQ